MNKALITNNELRIYLSKHPFATITQVLEYFRERFEEDLNNATKANGLKLHIRIDDIMNISREKRVLIDGIQRLGNMRTSYYGEYSKVTADTQTNFDKTMQQIRNLVDNHDIDFIEELKRIKREEFDRISEQIKKDKVDVSSLRRKSNSKAENAKQEQDRKDKTEVDRVGQEHKGWIDNINQRYGQIIREDWLYNYSFPSNPVMNMKMRELPNNLTNILRSQSRKISADMLYVILDSNNQLLSEYNVLSEQYRDIVVQILGFYGKEILGQDEYVVGNKSFNNPFAVSQDIIGKTNQVGLEAGRKLSMANVTQTSSITKQPESEVLRSDYL